MPHERFQSITQFPLRLLLNGKGRSRIGLNLIGVVMFGAIGLLAQAVSAASLTSWQYDPRANQLEITVKEGTTPKYFLMAQPARIVLDLPDTEVGDVKLKESYEGAIRQVRVSQFQPGLARIVLELSPDAALAAEQVKLESSTAPNGAGLKRWILRPVMVGAPSTGMAGTASKSPAMPQKAPAPVEPNPPASIAAKPTGQRAADAASELPPQPKMPTSTGKASLNGRAPEAEFALPEIPAPKILAAPMSVEVPSMNPSRSRQAVSTTQAANPDTLPPAKNQRSATTASDKVTSDQALISPSAIGSDVSPVTFEPLPSKIPVPAPQTAPPATTPQAEQQIAQRLIEATTPLPPATPQLSTLGVDGASAQMVLPSSVAPAAPSEILIEAPQAAPRVSVPPVSSVVMQSGDRPSIPPTRPLAPATEIKNANLEIPSTLRIRPTESPTIEVPPLTSQVSRSTAIPQTDPKRPTSSVFQAATTSSQLSDVTAMQSPSSSVMHLSPTQPISQPAVLQPPPSGVMQSPASSPAISMQSPASSANSSAGLVFPPVLAPTPSNAPPTVSVPPLQPSSAGSPASVKSSVSPAVLPPATPSLPATPTTIEFGQPLPAQGPTSLNPFPQNTVPVHSGMGWQAQTVFQSSNPTVLLPMGTVLTLSYPGNEALKLETDTPRQEVLLLQTEVRDAAGTIVLPRGSYVIGQFQTDRTGSKFIASAIQVGNRSIPFSGESEAIVGNRDLSTSTMAIYSGAGALAGGALSNFSGLGLLLGGAAGAAANYLTAPKPATLQPGQLIPVRVIRDL